MGIVHQCPMGMVHFFRLAPPSYCKHLLKLGTLATVPQHQPRLCYFLVLRLIVSFVACIKSIERFVRKFQNWLFTSQINIALRMILCCFLWNIYCSWQLLLLQIHGNLWYFCRIYRQDCRRICCTCIRMKLSIRTIRTLCPLQTLVMLWHFWIQFVARCAIVSSHILCPFILSSSIDRLVSTCGWAGLLEAPNYIGCSLCLGPIASFFLRMEMLGKAQLGKADSPTTSFPMCSVLFQGLCLWRSLIMEVWHQCVQHWFRKREARWRLCFSARLDCSFSSQR